eukprot:scaffold80420_cov49-Cyclotella_meneghiniana.AAC.4
MSDNELVMSGEIVGCRKSFTQKTSGRWEAINQVQQNLSEHSSPLPCHLDIPMVLSNFFRVCEKRGVKTKMTFPKLMMSSHISTTEEHEKPSSSSRYQRK